MTLLPSTKKPAKNASPGRADLERMHSVPIITVPKQYVGMTDKAARHEARSQAKAPGSRILGQFTNLATGWVIHTYPKGISKSLSHNQPLVRSSLIWKLPELIQQAVNVDRQPDRKGRNEILAVYIFYVRVSLDGADRHVKIIVRKHVDGKMRCYNMDIWRQTTPERD